MSENTTQKHNIGLSNPLMFFATFVLCTVAMNADLSSSRLIWWGSVGFFAFSWLCTSNMRFTFDAKYTTWLLCFWGFCAFSILWASSASLVTTVLKSAVMHIFILLMIRSSIRSKKDLERLIMILILASIVNSLYLMAISMGGGSSGGSGVTDRLGSEEGWNANSVGMMAAVGSLFIIYYMLKTRKTSMKIILFLLACGMVFVSLISGSRKALLIVLVGIAVYLFLMSGKKRLTSWILLITFALVLMYVIMKVPFFYSIIGWRVEEMIEALLGIGSGDSSFQSRKVLISAAIDAWMESPIIGHGLDCFRIFGKIATGRDYYAHNNYVELLADIGVVGTLIYYSAHIYAGRKLLRQLKNRDRTAMLCLTLLGIVLMVDIACVSYVDFLFEIVIMILFAFITIQDAEMKGET